MNDTSNKFCILRDYYKGKCITKLCEPKSCNTIQPSKTYNDDSPCSNIEGEGPCPMCPKVDIEKDHITVDGENKDNFCKETPIHNTCVYTCAPGYSSNKGDVRTGSCSNNRVTPCTIDSDCGGEGKCEGPQLWGSYSCDPVMDENGKFSHIERNSDMKCKKIGSCYTKYKNKSNTCSIRSWCLPNMTQDACSAKNLDTDSCPNEWKDEPNCDCRSLSLGDNMYRNVSGICNNCKSCIYGVKSKCTPTSNTVCNDKPVEPKPDESKPDETKPVEPNPDESKPDETKPDEPKPDEPKPVEPNPDESKPDESKPVEPKPSSHGSNKKSELSGATIAVIVGGCVGILLLVVFLIIYLRNH